MANSFAALRTVKLAASQSGSDSAYQKASVKAWATASRGAPASLGLKQQKIDRSNFGCPHDPPYLICLNLYFRVVANRPEAAPVRHRCAPRPDPSMEY